MWAFLIIEIYLLGDVPVLITPDTYIACVSRCVARNRTETHCFVLKEKDLAIRKLSDTATTHTNFLISYPRFNRSLDQYMGIKMQYNDITPYSRLLPISNP